MTEIFSLETMATPTGRMLIVTDGEERLRALDWEDCAPRLQRLLRRHYGEDGFRLSATAAPSPTARALEAYFEHELGAIDALPTATNGTAFQRRVWEALRAIPAGETISYRELASRIGRPAATRAVGAANGANPIAIVVPCHRVIGAHADLTGYGGGLARKRWLLTHEAGAS